MNWKSASSYDYDLDLLVDFQASDQTVSSVGFFNPLCQGVMGNFDSVQQDGTNILSETVTFNAVGPYIYLVYVGQYLEKSVFDQPDI